MGRVLTAILDHDPGLARNRSSPNFGGVKRRRRRSAAVISAALSIEGLMLSAAAPPRRGLSTRRLLAACPCQHQGAACPPSPLDLECLLQTDEPNRNLAIGRLARSEDAPRPEIGALTQLARADARFAAAQSKPFPPREKRDKQDARPTTIIFSPPSRVFLQPSSHRDWRVRSGTEIDMAHFLKGRLLEPG